MGIQTWILATAATPTVGSPSFSREVLPVLSEFCYPCHGPDEKARKGGLRLDTADSAFLKAESGKAAILPGKSHESELIRRIETQDPDDVMPPPRLKKSLSPEQINTLRQWIDAGAVWGKHWAFEPLSRTSADRIHDSGWARNELDRWVFRSLESSHLKPAPEASRQILIRRLTLDLTGLPPTPTEVDSFVNDTRPEAYERLVDRLLGSRHYGERMAWDWLEVARYADSNGYQGDSDRTMWPWRDWVVSAFNNNLPFDQFTLWQLAGDLLPNASQEQTLATGFCRNHMINGEGGRIAEENRIDYVMDMTETVGTAWLGLTLTCARCHDHKYDPISQRDYFGLFAAFNQTPVTGADGNPQAAPNLELPSETQSTERTLLQSLHKEASQQLATMELQKFPRPDNEPIKASEKFQELPKEIQEHLAIAPDQRDAGRLDKLATHWKNSDAIYSRLLADLKGIRDRQSRLNSAIPKVMVMQDRKEPRETFMLVRGLYNKTSEKVDYRLPAVFSHPTHSAQPYRLGLAQWLVSPANPLTARVVVNRFWTQFFGIGLVKTPEDFGAQGEKPSHPELLDWLASEFIESGWNVKHLCRLIATSATYRQSSAGDPSLYERDPQNRLLARGPRFRMPSWMIRDQALAASGLLVDKTGGAPVNPYQPSGVWEEATFGNKRYTQDHGDDLYRRSVYTFWRRIVGPTVFFDTTPRQVCNVKPPRTNTPLHALTTLNDITYVEAARALATLILQQASTPSDRVDLAYRRLLCRVPTSEERQIFLNAILRYIRRFEQDTTAADSLLKAGESRLDKTIPRAELAAYTVVCSTLLNLDETLTKE